MLQLKHIVKHYGEGDNVVQALKDVNLEFRTSEFVSILGPSGCGKTTLLNIIGGLDRYTSGDLVIGGKSTKDFRAADWDAYRNHSVGFVFQSYNLIPHLTVLGNVELALTLSGVSPAERKRRATEALTKVGLESQIGKRPNQLSGGQQQRVAIARALVNDPEILLADEPTGALDSSTSLQIMDLLKEISEDRLIIMVTHNGEIAKSYSTRIISLLDGEVVDDTHPCLSENRTEGAVPEPETMKPPAAERAYKQEIRRNKRKNRTERKKTSMSFLTALNLSMRNLVTKKGRTFMTSFAGSIGIIGVALVLAISNGFSGYIGRMQSDTLAGYPITINREASTQDLINTMMNPSSKYEKFPEGTSVIPYDSSMTAANTMHQNNIDTDYLEYVDSIDKNLVSAVTKTKTVQFHVMTKTDRNELKYLNTSIGINTLMGSMSTNWQQMFDLDLIKSQYDVLGEGRFPEKEDEIVLVVDNYNRLSMNFLSDLGYTVKEGDNLDVQDFVGKQFKLVMNNLFYEFNSETGYYQSNKNYQTIYNTDDENTMTLEIVGVLRQKTDSSGGMLDSGLAYRNELMDKVFADAAASDVTKAQLVAGERNDPENGIYYPVVERGTLNYEVKDEKSYKKLLCHLGADDTPAVISIYPKDFKSKDQIKTYLDAYNADKEEDDKIFYTDMAEIMTSTMGQMVNIISYVLIAFAAISLIVSSIMIGIITYVSVIERTKEIGVLRSIGARKKDISRVFNAETLIIGFTAGLIGVLISALLTIPLNILIYHLAEISGIASLNPFHGILLIVISMALTLIAGLVPARIAAKKDPVVALRTE